MNKRSALIFAIMLAGMTGAVQAEIVPKGGPADARVKFVDYDATNVVRVVGHYGFATHIQFSQSESVESVAMGDTGAWEAAPRGNHLFLKPTAPEATTNMTVVTQPGNRVYTFVLTAHASQNGASPKPNDMFFQVTFRYPEDERRIAEESRQAQRTQNLLDQVPREGRNYNYWACGSKAVAPDEAMDDGRFTYLRFAANRDMPAIFEVMSNGKEALVNTTVEDDWIVVHRVVPKLMLRRGPEVACVENRAFDPNGISTPTGTVSPAVNRAVREPVR